MKLRTFFSIFFLILILLASMNLILGFFLGKTEMQRADAEQRLDGITALSEDFVIASQWQTRFARAFVETRDPRKMEHYNDISGIIEGKLARPKNYGFEYWDLVAGGIIPAPELKKQDAVSLEDRFLKLDITVDEFNLLRKAKELFTKMGITEQIAMHAVLGEFDDGTGTFSRKGKPDAALAQKLLYSQSYLAQNGELAKYVSEFKETITNRYKRLREQQELRSRELLDLNSYLGAGLFSIILAYVLFLRNRFLARTAKLMRGVNEISKGNLAVQIDVSGEDEIGELADAVSSMAANLSTAFETLEEKVAISEKTAVDLNNERARSEKQLHNILPATIAERLQGGEEVIAEVFPEVTVFFSDIVGFTGIAAKLGPHETVSLLNALFEKFDELIERHGVEKIKTIGDSYMVVGGVPNRDPLHCQHVAEFALEAMSFVKEFSSAYQFPIEMRMGIHTGTVAAEVLGKKKFSYDLWGDVVNVASRYESSSSTNSIHVSEAVKVRLSDDFVFLDGGTVELKGKGTAASYYLLGKKIDFPGVIEFKRD